MDAREVKDAVRRRHPGGVNGTMPGPWTVIEEYLGIDVLAFSAWSRPAGTPTGAPSYPIVGYEVKVSRGDYRREILRPDKRAAAVSRCHAFYFATPKGLLTKEERAYTEPEHFEGQAFQREPCPARCLKPHRQQRDRGIRLSGRWIEVPTAFGDRACRTYTWRKNDDGVDEGYRITHERPGRRWEVCETCEGRGYLRQSIVEQEAPTLWVPGDVGLVEVTERSCRVVRKAPINAEPTENWSISQLVRFVSMRPDPRHHEPVALEAVA